MNIKQKLYSLGFIAILGVVTLLATSTKFANTTEELNKASYLVAQLEIRLLNLRRNEKDFLLRKDMKYLDKFNKNMETFLSYESQLSTILADNNLPSSAQLRTDINHYKDGFTQLVRAFETHGLNKEVGLLGSYYSKMKETQTNSSSEKLIKLYSFNSKVMEGELDASLGSNFSNDLVTAAKALVEQKVVIGLKYNEGLLGNTRGLSHTVEEQFKSFSAALDEELLSSEERLDLIKQLVTLLIIIVIIALVYQISRSINLQVAQLLKVIQEISETNDVGRRSELKGKNELVSIGEYFNRLLDKLEALISGSQAKSSSLAASTGNMHNALQDVIEQFHVQADHTTTMATSVQEMVATINEISESTAVAVEGVQQAANNAQDGRKVVESTVSNISQLSSTLHDSQQSISSLNEHVDQIGGAVTIIQGIAEQTNLLALNAAIELLVLVNKAVALPWLQTKFVLWRVALINQQKRSPKWFLRFKVKCLRLFQTLINVTNKAKKHLVPLKHWMQA